MEAKAFVAEGSSLEFQGGGSSHGLIELIYRLHASRFKVLLTAAKTPKEDRKVAISEAVRIAEKYWFAKPEDISEANPVDKMWTILCDIVDGLAYCRKEQPFFHRSVFRHAQALMWAPLFNNPEGALEGSMCSLPAHKGRQIRGSDGGPCAKSAESIISALFDKKRCVHVINSCNHMTSLCFNHILYPRIFVDRKSSQYGLQLLRLLLHLKQ